MRIHFVIGCLNTFFMAKSILPRCGMNIPQKGVLTTFSEM